MTTLLITHPGLPRPSQPGRPSGAAGSPARHRAGARAGTLPAAGPGQAPAAALETITLCHPLDYVNDIRTPRRRPGWRGSMPIPRCRPAASKRRCAQRAAPPTPSTRSWRGARATLRRHPPARPSCRDRAADGLLPVQQRRHRRAPRAEAPRHRAGRGRRFRRAPRQRLTEDLLVRSHRDVLLDPPDAALSGHRWRRASAASTVPWSMRRFRRATAASIFATPSRPRSCRGCGSSSPISS